MISPPTSAHAAIDGIPVISSDALPAVTAAEMAEVDRLAVDVFGITLLQMMEQAGSHLADRRRRPVGGDLRGSSFLVAVGPGNNGGGGLVAARHLVNRGARVQVVLARPARRLSEAGRHQLATLLEMGVSCCMAVYDITDAEIDEELDQADLVIDAVLGYRGRGAPHDEVAALIDRIVAAGERILSLDLPSGMDADTGMPRRPLASAAAATMTLALPKSGCSATPGRARAGRSLPCRHRPACGTLRRMGLSVGRPSRPVASCDLERPA